jgi:hypothetical protein
MRSGTLEERFWAKVDKTPGFGPQGECWEWTGGFSSNGYPLIRDIGSRREIRGNRLAFFLQHGRWPNSCALHRCDNPRCVRWEHIFEGTRQDNVADCIAKGRHANQNHTHCKRGHPLTPETTYLVRSTKTYRVCRECNKLRKKHKRSKGIIGL